MAATGVHVVRIETAWIRNALVAGLLFQILLAQGQELQACRPSSRGGETCWCQLAEVHPTQMAVGMREVLARTSEISQQTSDPAKRYLALHPAPAVNGPGGKLYITDRHHLARTLIFIGVDAMACQIEADLSGLGVDAFWSEMGQRGWVHPYGADGARYSYADLPPRIVDVADDPYRSLAGFVREACGYRKTDILFVEFQWADFFRPRVTVGTSDADFARAIEQGVMAARSTAARELPGYCGGACNCSERPPN